MMFLRYFSSSKPYQIAKSVNESCHSLEVVHYSKVQCHVNNALRMPSHQIPLWLLVPQRLLVIVRSRETNKYFFLRPKRLHLPPHCNLNLVDCLTIFNRLRAAAWRGSSRRSLVSLLLVMQPRPDGHKGSPSPDGHKKQNRLSSPSPLCINHWPPPASQPCPLPTNNIWFMALHMCQLKSGEW